MEVEIRLFAGFRNGRFKKRPATLAEGTALRDVVRELGIAEEEVSLPLVNGEYSPLDRVLRPGDVVSLFPAVGGG